MSRLTGDDAPRALNTLAREQMKLRLLADVRTDMTVCEIEGWDQGEHIHDLHTTLQTLCPCRRSPL